MTPGLCTHMFRDKALITDIRSTVKETLNPGPKIQFDMKKLGDLPLLSSIYAEALRFGVQIDSYPSMLKSTSVYGRLSNTKQ